MPEPADLDLRTPESGDPAGGVVVRPPNRPTGTVVGIALFVVAVGFAIYLVFGREAADPVTTEAPAAPTAPAPAPAVPLGAAAEPIDVPPLGESDPLIRELVAKLSAHPRLAAWLATDGLIRNFTVVVANIAEGHTPATHLRSVAPSGPFRIAERGGAATIDPRSYQRYDTLADAFASIDAAGSARLYTAVKPRIEEASRELGHPAGAFDRLLERAIVSLLAVPTVPGTLEVGPRGIVYGYADKNLESLTAAQKHLLRTGPRNVRLVQDKLREIGLALGIPADRLQGRT